MKMTQTYPPARFIDQRTKGASRRRHSGLEVIDLWERRRRHRKVDEDIGKQKSKTSSSTNVIVGSEEWEDHVNAVAECLGYDGERIELRGSGAL